MAVNVTVKGGSVSIRTPYDAGFVANLKSATKSRRWDPANKVWTVDIDELELALNIVRAHWGDVEVEGLATKTTEPEPGIDPARIAAIKAALTWPIYDHQAEAVARLEDGASILQMEMGTGKTRSVLSYWTLHRDEYTTLLVVCPAAVIRSWQEEIAKLGLPEPAYMRRGKLRGDYESPIVLTNVELYSKRSSDELNSLIETLILEKTLVVIDESHTIKNAKARRTQSIVEMLGGARKKVVMTGTITTRDISDLWQQVDFAVPGLLGEYWDFLRSYAVLNRNRWGHLEILGTRHLSQLRQLLAPHRLIKTRDECLTLPETQDIWVTCDLTPAQIRALTELERGILETPDGDTKKVANEWAKARQIVGGQVYYLDGEGDDAPRRVATYESGKITALLDVLEEVESRVVVMCEYQHEVDRVGEAVREAGRQVYGYDQIDAWRSDQTGALVMTTAKGGVGLNLQDASVMVFFSIGTNAALYEQAKARIYRAGQTRKCLFVHLVTDHWVEDTLRSIMEHKLHLHEALLGIKDRIKKKTGVAG